MGLRVQLTTPSYLWQSLRLRNHWISVAQFASFASLLHLSEPPPIVLRPPRRGGPPELIGCLLVTLQEGGDLLWGVMLETVLMPSSSHQRIFPQILDTSQLLRH